MPTARVQTRGYQLGVVLTLAGVFSVGGVWWCEDCGGGGFGKHDPARHRRITRGTRSLSCHFGEALG
jgi:hypothetical protein